MSPETPVLSGDAPASPDAPAAGRAGVVLGWLALGALTALFGYAVWAAVGNLIGIRAAASTIGLGVTTIGTVWLLVGIALPPIVYAVALWLGRGLGRWQRALLLLAGLATVAVLQLDMMNLVKMSTYFG